MRFKYLLRIYLVAFSLLSFNAVSHSDNVIDVKLNDNVIQIDDKNAGLNLLSINGNELTFTTNNLSSLSKGTILVSGASAKAPNGFAKFIENAQIRDGEVTVITRNADLNEIYAHGRIKISSAIQEPIRVIGGKTSFVTPEIEAGHRFGKLLKNQTADITTTQTLEGNTRGIVVPDGDGYFRLRFQGTVSGLFTRVDLKVRPVFEFVWEKEDGAIRPKLFKSVVHLNLKDTSIGGAIGFEQSFKIATLHLPPLAFFAGVPIVLNNSITLEATGRLISGQNVSGGLNIKSGDVTLGAQYERNVGWDNLSKSDLETEFTRPVIKGGDIKAVLIFPKLKFNSKPYGVKNFAFSTGLETYNTLSYKKEPQEINLDTFQRLVAAINVKFLGIFKSEFSYIYDFPEYNIYKGSINGLKDTTLPKPVKELKPSDMFTDIKENWAYNEISFFIDKGYSVGYPDKTFRPNNYVTRAEYMVMLASIIDTTPKPECKDRKFNDISGHWAEENILAVARSCWVSGYPDNSFRPENSLTRQEMYIALTSQAGLTQYDETEMRKVLLDDDLIADWALKGLAKIYSNGLMVNYPHSNLFSPNSLATRADVTSALYRMLVWNGNFVNAWESPYIAKY